MGGEKKRLKMVNGIVNKSCKISLDSTKIILMPILLAEFLEIPMNSINTQLIRFNKNHIDADSLS